MDLSVGSVVRVKEGVVLRIGREIVSVSADEVLLVADVREYSVRVKSLKREIDFWVGKSFVEVGRRFVEAPRKSLGKVNFNPAPKLNEQDILALIDIAIDTGDKQWFDELHSKLSALA